MEGMAFHWIYLTLKLSKMKRSIFFSGLVALVVSISSIGIANYYFNKHKVVKIEHINSIPSQSTLYTLDKNGDPVPIDFNETAERVLDGVVHIKSTHVFGGNSQSYEFRSIPDPFSGFFR